MTCQGCWGKAQLVNSIFFILIRASLVAQMVKNLPAIWETWVQSLGQEDPLEKEMATHSSILAWRIPWIEEPGGLQFMGSQRVRHNWATNTFILTEPIFSVLDLRASWNVGKYNPDRLCADLLNIPILALTFSLVFSPTLDNRRSG